MVVVDSTTTIPCSIPERHFFVASKRNPVATIERALIKRAEKEYNKDY